MTSLLDKVWAAHLVDQSPGQPDLLYIDRHLIHEVTSPQAFAGLRLAGRPLRRPDLTFGVADHVVPTDNFTRPLQDQVAETQLAALEQNQAEFGLKVFFGINDPRQGVIHVTMAEQGVILPGNTVVCGDSHTATHGAFGAISFGIGTSEVEQVMATQTLYQTKPQQLAVELTGLLPPEISAKDLILKIIQVLGVAGGTGRAIEFTGEAVRALSMESRLTLSNMAIECGARMGIIAPDTTTFEYLQGRPLVPAGPDFTAARTWWETLTTDLDHHFGEKMTISVHQLAPQVTWGTNPAQGTDITGIVPHPHDFQKDEQRLAAQKALHYQDLKPGTKMSDILVDYVFIGSCTNGRLEDLRQAAAILKGRQVAAGVTVLVVPGSGLVKKQAEAEGLADIFKESGCQWRSPGCSMCLAMNPDRVPAGKRCVSTSNRNFEGRQGRDSRTHLAGPALAAASAVTGRLTDPRESL